VRPWPSITAASARPLDLDECEPRFRTAARLLAQPGLGDAEEPSWSPATGQGHWRWCGKKAEVRQAEALAIPRGEAGERKGGARRIGDPHPHRWQPAAGREVGESGLEHGVILRSHKPRHWLAEEGLAGSAEARLERACGEGHPLVTIDLDEKVGSGKREGQEPLPRVERWLPGVALAVVLFHWPLRDPLTHCACRDPPTARSRQG
jgi:hypothetical protein